MTSAIRLLAAGFVLGACMAFAACGDDDNAPPAPTPTSPAAIATATASTPEATPTPGASPSPSPTPAATATPTSSAGLARCTSPNLKLEVLPAGAAAGTHFISLALTNTGTSACQVEGYPGVSLVDASTTLLGVASRAPNIPVTSIRLAPGEAAHAMVALPAYQNFPAGTCMGPSKQIFVYPPDETQLLSAPFEDYVCPGFSVRALEPGRNEAGR